MLLIFCRKRLVVFYRKSTAFRVKFFHFSQCIIEYDDFTDPEYTHYYTHVDERVSGKPVRTGYSWRDFVNRIFMGTASSTDTLPSLIRLIHKADEPATQEQTAVLICRALLYADDNQIRYT